MSRYGVKTELECLPCFFGQVARTLKHAEVNGDRGRDILRRTERVIEKASLDEVPARTTTIIHRILREETGLPVMVCGDPISAADLGLPLE